MAQSPTVSHTDHRSPESPILGSPESPTFKPTADLTIQDVPRTSSLSESVAPMATPKEIQPVGSEGPFVFTEDPALTPSFIQRLQERRLLPTIQKYCRDSYARDASGYQPYTELVLADSIDCLEDSLIATEKLLNDERAARRLADDRLVNAELLVKFLRGDTTSEGANGVKRPRD
jgi:hypothetical protein